MTTRGAHRRPRRSPHRVAHPAAEMHKDAFVVDWLGSWLVNTAASTRHDLRRRLPGGSTVPGITARLAAIGERITAPLDDRRKASP